MVCENISAALERLLLFAYTENTESSPPSSLESLIIECNEDNLRAVPQDPTVTKYLDGYLTFQDKVKSGMLVRLFSFGCLSWIMLGASSC